MYLYTVFNYLLTKNPVDFFFLVIYQLTISQRKLIKLTSILRPVVYHPVSLLTNQNKVWGVDKSIISIFIMLKRFTSKR